MPRAAVDAGAPENLGLSKEIRVCHGIRTLRKSDLKLNGETPDISVDPQTYDVRVDGELISSNPNDSLPMAQRYFLF